MSFNSKDSENFSYTRGPLPSKNLYEEDLKARTPSPGRDYSSLLHETPTNK